MIWRIEPFKRIAFTGMLQSLAPSGALYVMMAHCWLWTSFRIFNQPNNHFLVSCHEGNKKCPKVVFLAQETASLVSMHLHALVSQQSFMIATTVSMQLKVAYTTHANQQLSYDGAYWRSQAPCSFKDKWKEWIEVPAKTISFCQQKQVGKMSQVSLDTSRTPVIVTTVGS